uniref:Titin n=1 Tax=Bombyx mori TaxID=7091 RepID=A0A8R2HRS7_BOMMO
FSIQFSYTTHKRKTKINTLLNEAVTIPVLKDATDNLDLIQGTHDQEKDTPPVPIKTYQWEDLKRAREVGAYPWTHLLKPPLEGEVTAEDIIRETTPRRSMSREFSRSRTHSPVDSDIQKILNLDSSPGSSRKHGDEGEDEGVHIPNFSKEVSLDEEDIPGPVLSTYIVKRPESQSSVQLMSPVEIPKLNVSPKGILKRRVPDQYIGVTETREKTKCCHPLVNKIKHLADKTLHKLDRSDLEKSPLSKRKKNENTQEIRQLRHSPGAVRRQKFSAMKLGDSDEMSKTMSIDTPPPRKKKEHIYEDIEESKQDNEKSLHFSKDVDKQISTKADDESKSVSNKENDSIAEKKSIASLDPSLITDNVSLKSGERVMEKLHKQDEKNKEAVLLDEEMDPDEPNVDEIFQNQLDETRRNNESPNITITEITDDDVDGSGDSGHHVAAPIETSPSPSPQCNVKDKDIKFINRKWSKQSSDHEYEIIEKPPPNIVYTAPSVDEASPRTKVDDDLSSTTSLERKLLQHTSDEDEPPDDKDSAHEDTHENILNAEALQRDIEDRFFVNTPSTMSRTECEISTSQVDSSALEQLPLKRDSRSKNPDSSDSKLQQRFRESTGKLKTQAGKLKTKLQNMKTNRMSMPERPRFSLPERSKVKTPDKPKMSLPDRPKLTPDKRKFKLPERPKLKKFNITLPDRPKFNVPDLSKFKMPDRPKINFPSLGRKKDKIETSSSTTDVANVATVDFEAKTYPRLFNRKKKSELQKTSSSPTLNRDDTPPLMFTFNFMKKSKEDPGKYVPESPEELREYGVNNDDNQYNTDINNRRRYETTYDFDKVDTEYMDEEQEETNLEIHNTSSSPDISPSKQEYTPVITEINNDEFFVRPRGISRENIQVREYLSDETRQAFQNPKNVLALMGSSTEVNHDNLYMNDVESEFIDENEMMRYSSEDLNDKDDGYYTFPPVRPSRAKRKKERKEEEPTPYIDESANASLQFSEVDLDMRVDNVEGKLNGAMSNESFETNKLDVNRLDFTPATDLHSIHEYANDEVIQYPENIPIQSQTLPMPPKRRKKFGKKDIAHSSLNDFKNVSSARLWEDPQEQHTEDIIVYRTEHEYVIPPSENIVTEHSPVPPRRNRSQSSRATSLCDDDRTSHGAESLTLDTHMALHDDVDGRDLRHESPGYATVDKVPYTPSKGLRRSVSATPPVRRRKSNSSERKYYTVGPSKAGPDRPPRKKSSTSLMTLGSYTKRSVSSDITQYVEIDDAFEMNKDLKSGEIINKMKDRPLPPPPRPPRGSRRKKKTRNYGEGDPTTESERNVEAEFDNQEEIKKNEDIVEIEVSTQTDPLPDDVDFELDENLDISMSSSLRDIVDEDSLMTRSHPRLTESPRTSRPTSRSEKSLKFSDPKISELSKPHIGRTSPTVILVEKRVSSPTRINERDVMLTEASLTVQPIDIDETQIPDVPPLPRSKGISGTIQGSKNSTPLCQGQAVERVADATRDVQLDNLVTQRLQVRDLDVGRLNVSELQANKILVSDIEGMTLQVSELDSKSGHISVSGIEFSQSVIDEIVKKFAEISTGHGPSQNELVVERSRPVSHEEQTQTEEIKETKEKIKQTVEEEAPARPSPPQRLGSSDDGAAPPLRPPPPDLTPLLYSYLQDLSIPPASLAPQRPLRERHFPEFHEPQHQTPPPPARRAKRKPTAPHTESSSDDGRLRPSPRRMPPPVRTHETSIAEAGVNFLRVCQSSISRTLRNVFNSFMAYINRTEDKRDAQMALVIFLVLIAGLIMFGLSDSKTIHHHHWEFFNPPDGKP